MLAACVDASGSGPSLLSYIQHCIEQGLPDLHGEFSLHVKRVWKSEMGSIAASYVTVQSRYNHASAPVPVRSARDENIIDETETPSHSHNHGHSHSHHHTHGHEHSLESNPVSGQDTMGESHTHNHAHDSQVGPLRNLPQIRDMLLSAPTSFIPVWVRDHALQAFTELAKAEAKTHGAESQDAVHFHEVGAVDSIVDTVGTLLALDCLGVRSVSCSRLPLGEGTVWTDHGLLPVPAPATLRLLEGMPTCPGPPGVTGELITPTAAALLKVLTKSYSSKIPGRPPSFTIRKIGIGAGTKEFVKHPNIIRLVIGDDVVKDNRKVS